MAFGVDLSVEFQTNRGPVTLKTPFIPGSCEICNDDNTINRAIANGVGGVVVKSLGLKTAPDMVKTTSRPWAFPLTKFGPTWREAWVHNNIFFELENTPEKVIKHIPRWKKMCQAAGVPLIISVCDVQEDLWPKWAKMVEEAGADYIELDASCPQGKQAESRGGDEKVMFSEEQWCDITAGKRIISSVAKVTTVPFTAKLAPYHTPPTIYAKAWKEAGLSYLLAHNALPGQGIFIDIDAEEVFGNPGQTTLHAGSTMVPLSLSRIAHIMREVPDLPIIGIGGINNVSDAIRYLLLGCQAVSIASGVFFKGHRMFQQLADGLAEWMKKHGYTRIDQFRGKCREDAIITKADWEEKYGYKMEPPEWGMLLPDKNPSPVVTRVDKDKCDFCGRCDVCLYGALQFDRKAKTLEFDDKLCMGCGFCVGLCPLDALYMIDKRTNEVIWDNKGMVKVFKKPGGWSAGYHA